MLFVVILLYGVCWAPIKLYQCLLDYGLISFCTSGQLYALVCTYFACHWIAMSNSFVNPIVYSFMSKSFRVSDEKKKEGLNALRERKRQRGKFPGTYIIHLDY
jgi:hypothetical protein